MLASLQGQLALGLALDALQSQDDLLGGLGLLVENGLGLTTITALLPVITSLTLGEQGGLASLVLGDLVLGVLLAGLALAIGLAGLGDVDLPISQSISQPADVLLFLFAGAVSCLCCVCCRNPDSSIVHGWGLRT